MPVEQITCSRLNLGDVGSISNRACRAGVVAPLVVEGTLKSANASLTKSCMRISPDLFVVSKSDVHIQKIVYFAASYCHLSKF